MERQRFRNVMFDIEHNGPRRAAEQACAWLAVVRFTTFTIAGYVRGGPNGHVSEPPRCEVAPAAPSSSRAVITTGSFFVSFDEARGRVRIVWRNFGPLSCGQRPGHEFFLDVDGESHLVNNGLYESLLAAFRSKEEAEDWGKRQVAEYVARHDAGRTGR